MLLPERLERALRLFLILVPVLLLSGCTASYWRTLLQTSQVTSVVTSNGKIVWTGETTADDSGVFTTTWSVSRTPPVIALSLVEGSAALDLEYLYVEYLSPVGDDPRGTGIGGLDYIVFPYIAHLLTEESLNLSLPEILTSELVDAADPNNADSELYDYDVDARITFYGRNKLGQRIIWKTVVPIGIDVVRL
jgi:hypothetical protein